MTAKYKIEEPRPTCAIFVDGNDGTGKTTLVRGLREYLDKLERVFGEFGVQLHDRGVATQATESAGPHSICPSDVYVFLDASPETSQRRLAERGADLAEEYHTLESLEDYRRRFRSIAADMERELERSESASDHVLIVDAEEPPRRVLLQVLRHLRMISVLPSLAFTLKALAAESSVLALEAALSKERAERNANAVALAQAVQRADRVELTIDAVRRSLQGTQSTIKRARQVCSDEKMSELLDDALRDLTNLGACESPKDTSADEMIALAQAVAAALPEQSSVLRRLNAELLWRRVRDGLVPFAHDETKPPPGWMPCKERPGWFRKSTFRSADEILSGPHFSSTHAVESHPPERAWEIFKSEHAKY